MFEFSAEQVEFDANVGRELLFTDQPRSTVLLQPVSEFGHYVASLKCNFFFCRRPLPFGGSPLEAYSRTSGESNHHRQSVRVVKNDALPTEPRGHLASLKCNDV